MKYLVLINYLFGGKFLTSLLQVYIRCNLCDFTGAATPGELISVLGVDQMRDRKWYVQAACAVTGDGIYEALETLAGYVKEFKCNNRHRY